LTSVSNSNRPAFFAIHDAQQFMQYRPEKGPNENVTNWNFDSASENPHFGQEITGSWRTGKRVFMSMTL